MTEVLNAEEITVGYGGQPVVFDLSLKVEEGQIVALLGANGAGKSTTMLSLVGELPVSSGKVELFGESTKAAVHKRVRSGLAFVPEGRSVFKGLTAADNLKVGFADPQEVLALFPELESRLPVRGGLLSGGEQQMLTLGRALVRKPKLLLADELSLGLGPKIVDRLLGAVRSASRDKGMGALLVEQQVRKVLKYADHVYVLRRGRLELSMSGSGARSRISEIERAYLAAAS